MTTPPAPEVAALRQRIQELEEGLNEVSRFTPEMAENLANWIDGKSPHDVAQSGLRRLAENLRRAASLLEGRAGESGEDEGKSQERLSDDEEPSLDGDPRLQACPFCGCLAWLHVGASAFSGHSDGRYFGYRIECEGHCHAMTCWWHTEQEAIDNWNRRAPTPHEASDDQVERVARIIDPGSWSVMDAEKERFLRKYKGENIGYPEDQFRHKESMAKASAILTIVLSEPVGYTNENQLKYVDSGGDRLFYPGDKSGASIALYQTHTTISALRMPTPAVDEGKLREIRERHEKWASKGFIAGGVIAAVDAHNDRAALLEMLDALTKGDRDAE